MSNKSKLVDLSSRNRDLFCKYGSHLKSLYHKKRPEVVIGLAVFRKSYWHSLRCCVFRNLRLKKQAHDFVTFLIALDIPAEQIRVILFCEPGSPMVSAWLRHMPPGIMVIFRNPPNSRSRAVTKWVGVDAVFPMGNSQALKGADGFVLLLRFAVRLLERQRVKRKNPRRVWPAHEKAQRG